jgi:hypothetical protein
MAVAAEGATVRSATVSLLLALAFAAIGVWVVTLAIDMVGIFGEGMGVDAESRKIYSHAHIAVHLFGTASAVAVGIFLTQRSWFLAVFAIVAIVACGGYGIVNMIGFTTTNRLSVSEARSTSNAADWTKYEKARETLNSQIRWARERVVAEEQQKEKRRLLAYIDTKTKELNSIEPPRPTAATVLADPQATWFAKLTGSSEESWRLSLPVPVAFLLFAAEVFCFVFAVHFLTQGIGAINAMVAAKRNRRKGGGNDGGGTKKPKETDQQPSQPSTATVPPVAATNVHQFPSVAVSLSPNESRVFHAANEHFARAGIIASQLSIGRELGMPKHAVTRALQGLEKKGKVKRERKGKFTEIHPMRPVGYGGSRYASAGI